MTEQEIVDLVQRSLFSVAPEFEGESIEPNTPFRDQFEIDSMDFLNFIIALHKATGIDIPEADYLQLETQRGAISYILHKLPANGTS